MTNLRDLRLWCDQRNNDPRHPQVVIQELGISYLYAIPQSIADQWWFLGCRNVPDILPPHIETMSERNPHEWIGHGLSVEMAENLVQARRRALSGSEEE